MGKFLTFLYKWGPVVIIMALIFIFSSILEKNIPDLAQSDFLVKKSGHMVGYCLLALTCWHGLGWDKKKLWLAWLVAILYAFTDEFHQSFVPGRTALLSDVAIDSISAGVGLFIKQIITKYSFHKLN